jgi:hypothetical protein
MITSPTNKLGVCAGKPQSPSGEALANSGAILGANFDISSSKEYLVVERQSSCVHMPSGILGA